MKKTLLVIARDLAGLTGGGLITWGVAMIYRPAGFIVAGCLLIGASLLLARAEPGE
jgi:hypothetical protein